MAKAKYPNAPPFLTLLAKEASQMRDQVAIAVLPFMLKEAGVGDASAEAYAFAERFLEERAQRVNAEEMRFGLIRPQE